MYACAWESEREHWGADLDWKQSSPGAWTETLCFLLASPCLWDTVGTHWWTVQEMQSNSLLHHKHHWSNISVACSFYHTPPLLPSFSYFFPRQGCKASCLWFERQQRCSSCLKPQGRAMWLLIPAWVWEAVKYRELSLIPYTGEVQQDRHFSTYRDPFPAEIALNTFVCLGGKLFSWKEFVRSPLSNTKWSNVKIS